MTGLPSPDPRDPAVTAVELARHLDDVAHALNYATRPGYPRLSQVPDAYALRGPLRDALANCPRRAASSPRSSIATRGPASFAPRRASLTPATRGERSSSPPRCSATPRSWPHRRATRSAGLSPRSSAYPTPSRTTLKKRRRPTLIPVGHWHGRPGDSGSDIGTVSPGSGAPDAEIESFDRWVLSASDRATRHDGHTVSGTGARLLFEHTFDTRHGRRDEGRGRAR